MKTRSGKGYRNGRSQSGSSHRLALTTKGSLKGHAHGVNKKSRKSRNKKLARNASKTASTFHSEQTRDDQSKKCRAPFRFMDLPLEVRLQVYEHATGEKHTHEVTLHPDFMEEGSKKTWIATRPQRPTPAIFNLAMSCRTVYREALVYVYQAIHVKMMLPPAAEMANILPDTFTSGIQAQLIKDPTIGLQLEPGIYKTFETIMQFLDFGKHTKHCVLVFDYPDDGSGYYGALLRESTSTAHRKALIKERNQNILNAFRTHFMPVWQKTGWQGKGTWEDEHQTVHGSSFWTELARLWT